MKKNSVKNQKGAVTLLVLVTILFFVTFLISTYLLVSNRAQSQLEMAKETKRIHASDDTEGIYNSLIGGNIVPVYTVDQLLAMGMEVNKPINELGGRIYSFSEEATYVLMNDLEFESDDWTPIWDMLQWEWINGFEGNGKTITVTSAEWGTYEFNEGNEYRYTLSDGTFATKVFKCVGRVQQFVVPKTGVYKLEVWGAQGGTALGATYTGGVGGKGGYSSGEVELTEGEILYIIVGQEGKSGSKGSENGYGGNGGFGAAGSGGSSGMSSNVSGGAGGGGLTGFFSSRTYSSSTALIIAGGGGGRRRIGFVLWE